MRMNLEGPHLPKRVEISQSETHKRVAMLPRKRQNQNRGGFCMMDSK